jgi:hypothetical protein
MSGQETDGIAPPKLTLRRWTAGDETRKISCTPPAGRGRDPTRSQRAIGED